MALTEDRVTPLRNRDPLAYPIAANVRIFHNALVVIDSAGRARPGRANATDRARGRARAAYDNTGGAAGAMMVEIETGVLRWNNSESADEIVASDIGKVAFVVDDEAVAKTSNSGARCIAGEIVDVDEAGVWVDTTAHDLVHASLVTTAGDILIATGAGTFRRLPLGTDGQVLKVVSGAVAWATDAT